MKFYGNIKRVLLILVRTYARKEMVIETLGVLHLSERVYHTIIIMFQSLFSIVNISFNPLRSKSLDGIEQVHINI